MGELTDKKIIKTRPLEVSPAFELPPGLDEGVLVYRSNVEDDDTEVYDVSPDDTTDGGTGTTRPARPVVPLIPPQESVAVSPTGMRVKSQTVRFNAQGQPVADVVIEFADVPRAVTYEFRLAQ